MANILDIFSTHTGERLLRRSVAVCNISKDKIHNGFILALPTILAIMKKEKSLEKIETGDLIHFIEEEDIINTGEKVLHDLLEEEHLEKLKDFGALIGIEHENFVQILHLTSGFLSVLINEILKKDTNLQFNEVVKNLTGEENNLNRKFTQVLVKNSDSPGIVDSAEQISLNRDNDKDDESILGGFTGGR
ncbi:hypothetical protein [Christiangramia sabulilitoris]|uniref:Uncharacterized protein n=1 Tax=Christiangramia sabulilitoris TaxID=2583991 RepID=A0A550I6K1_9FLAO|nr:hypothetical protein [Christiangramia sabulilitoris]TRO66593.1 hypothetical protein FGM01_01540 [Christiangramia sabulilitoris]